MKKRLLIVEDEAITALDLKYSLEELGYEIVDTVDTGQDAINTAAETVPDIVLMDIKLKGDMEGIEAAEIISELRIPIVYLTANTDTNTFEKSNVKGSYGFISKPYDINKLDKTLQITIKRAELEADKLNDASGFK
ncbi:response regulator [uncultured Methanobrevibacter sp.]|uniref:response regulator n=1 Tax=uncultured Methanobrevibacter sp. TaxID=253161 RepID=UPI0025E1F926|nr:response regulator [uncultured Methanobrevibacter sp.]MCI6994688.1 response regulator [Methanobrevibacter sp.]